MPYSVISAHLDEIALPPANTHGADVGEDDEPHHAPIGLTRHNSSQAEFEREAAKWRSSKGDGDGGAADLNAD